jgi:hypothetical protein
MKYLKWKLSEGVWGTYPVETIAAMGGKANTSEYVDGDGYRIAYLSEDVDISVLDSAWDVTEQTEAQALTFCQALYADAEVLPDGRISGPPPDDDV